MSSNNFYKHFLNDSIKYNFTDILSLFSSFPYSRAFIFHLFTVINNAALACHCTSTLPVSLIIT